ncbi:hypothetical protein tloyanaT_29040 [Thalassotalea loyana]|uniref:Polysaccharide biosynthesis protein n=1 Tax=Thalassotalea loyana TaxID=280483 RepID=A0ABQ6HEW1_9GAMM|nr:hypothetical protein tloyanaT_29040 [Thalassotalea loyana]
MFNAASVLAATSLCALFVGASDWAPVALMHTTFSYLILCNFGVNEGLGQKVVRFNARYFDVYQVLQNTFIVICIVSLLFSEASSTPIRDISFYIGGTSALLLFSLNRVFFRGVGSFKSLGNLYVVNGLILAFSPVLVMHSKDPFDFLRLLIFSSICGALINISYKKDAKFLLKKTNHLKVKRYCLVFINKTKKLAIAGFPLMLAGVTFEVIITIDRFYINSFYGEILAGNVAFSLMLVKGVIMLLSILNTIGFRALSVNTSMKNWNANILVIRKQVIIGISGCFVLVFLFFSVLSSNWFINSFPSYANTSGIFLAQSLLLIPLSFMFPLSVVSNFMFGGRVYLLMLMSIMLLYFSIVFIVHNLTDTLTIYELSFVVVSCFSCGVYLFSKYIFKQFEAH